MYSIFISLFSSLSFKTSVAFLRLGPLFSTLARTDVVGVYTYLCVCVLESLCTCTNVGLYLYLCMYAHLNMCMCPVHPTVNAGLGSLMFRTVFKCKFV